MKTSRSHGFTLVELMIVVAILGVLAAIAIPVFQKYLIKTKVSEAPMMLRKIMDGATAYFTVDHSDSAGQNLTPQFPAATGWYPAQLPRGTKVMPGAGDPPSADKESWNQLRFNLNEPVQFRYRFAATGNGVTSRADIAAESELVPGIVCRMERAAWTKGGNTLELQFSDLKIIMPPY